MIPVALSRAGAVGAAAVNISLSQDSVNVSMNMMLVENMTGTTGLPMMKTFLDPTNSSRVQGPMTREVARLVPGSTISGLTVRAETRIMNAPLQLWTLNENFSFTVSGSNTNLGGAVKSNLAFLSMNVSDSIMLGGTEANQVGSAYLLGALNTLPTTSTTEYFVNGVTLTNAVIPAHTAAGFRLLDFSWLPQVSSWTHQYRPFAMSSWRLEPPSPFNITVGVRQIENVFIPKYVAVYSSSVELTAPAGAWSDGSAVWFNLSTPVEPVMVVIILASLGIGVGTFVVDRRLSRQMRTRRKK